ncbi:hypothetical protein [Kushneria phosphatilytica]|uniref:Uncharacterized protein n=1 Tax=Kushneria phosphatilytica TaxID=657387 RepID=A0A1S1NR51_9GAMM|nr:hypothetical protein [Kushneria phosphatilytica]OHV07534.1 hypothetical protein BH688_15025 [Kushneria phosphatilytica]QEL10019.1 hypothetical protein FY550_01975 [Kushneria phosphatilytica]
MSLNGRSALTHHWQSANHSIHRGQMDLRDEYINKHRTAIRERVGRALAKQLALSGMQAEFFVQGFTGITLRQGTPYRMGCEAEFNEGRKAMTTKLARQIDGLAYASLRATPAQMQQLDLLTTEELTGLGSMEEVLALDKWLQAMENDDARQK